MYPIVMCFQLSKQISVVCYLYQFYHRHDTYILYCIVLTVAAGQLSARCRSVHCHGQSLVCTEGVGHCSYVWDHRHLISML